MNAVSRFKSIFRLPLQKVRFNIAIVKISQDFDSKQNTTSQALPKDLFNPYTWLHCSWCGNKSWHTSQLRRLFCSPCYQQVQAWIVFLCTKGGIDGNKQLRLVGQVLQVAYGKVLGIFPVPLPPSCSCLPLSSAELRLDSIHTRNANAMPMGIWRWLVRRIIRSVSEVGWHSNLKSDVD